MCLPDTSSKKICRWLISILKDASLHMSTWICAKFLPSYLNSATLWTVARQALLSMGFSRQERWMGLTCPSPGDLPNPGTEPESPQFSSVAQSCPTLCNPMNCSTPGFLVKNQLLELAKLMSIELVMPSNHLILCHPLLLLPSIFPSIRVFSNESVLSSGGQSIGVSVSG